MREILLASTNKGKISEFNKLLVDSNLKIVSLDEIGKRIPAPEETGKTFKENALEKARYYSHESGYVCIADDSGLEVDALDKRPGINSARFIKGTDVDRYMSILKELDSSTNRSARYVCLLAYVDINKKIEKTFRGTLEGKIGNGPKGVNGFGFDPIFVPEGYNQTVAELGIEVKNKISHRARAIQKMKKWLEDNN